MSAPRQLVYELGTKTVISLPGVPREMEYLMQNFARGYLKQRYGLKRKLSSDLGDTYHSFKGANPVLMR